MLKTYNDKKGKECWIFHKISSSVIFCFLLILDGQTWFSNQIFYFFLKSDHLSIRLRLVERQER